MNDYLAHVISNTKLYDGAYKLELEFDENLPPVKGGQFAMLKIGDAEKILRRPLGICVAYEDYAAFVYQVKGGGTQSMTKLKQGDEISVTLPLGNGFPIGEYKNIAIVGGGFGIVPLYMTAAQYGDKDVHIYNGFQTKKQVILKKEFSALGKLTICTDDGSEGFHGFPTDALKADCEKQKPDVIFCCGPTPLMKSVKAFGAQNNIKTYLSLEARMGCGVGACLTCTCKVAGHNKRVCKDGPVFDAEEVFE